MTSTLSTSRNSHVAALEIVLTEATQAIECLVIAHNDPKMLSALRPALAGEAAAVLEVSQDVWDFNGNQLPQAIEWALEKMNVRQLVLVGHTLAGGPKSRASLATSDSSHVQLDGYRKLIDGVHLNSARNRAAQDQLAAQVKHLLQIPAVQSRCYSGELIVYGLLYRADSGLFLAYDTDADEFHPLVPR